MRHFALRTIALAIAGMALTPPPLSAQITSPPERVVMELVLRDDTTLFGYVQSAGAVSIAFETVQGDVRQVPRSDVASLLPILGHVRKGQFWRVDPFESRLFFGATGRALRRNHGYAGAFGAAFAPFVQGGLTDRVSMGAGSTVFLTPLLLSAKVQLLRGRYNSAAAGIVHAEATYYNGSAGVAYVVDTMGTPGLGVTIGAGRGHSSDRGESVLPFGIKSRSTIWLVGFDYRVTPRVKFLTEHFAAKEGSLHIMGVRLISDVVGVDLGIAFLSTERRSAVLPVVNVCWKIGR